MSRESRPDVTLSASEVISELKRRGDLVETAPGFTLLRGDVAELRQQLDHALRGVCADLGGSEWEVPGVLPFETLARADYFASFPQWLTAVCHMDHDERVLAGVADADDPMSAAGDALRNTTMALQPAVCYHVYNSLAGRTITAQSCAVGGTCWRHEAEGFTPLERGWSFTMREAVHVGSEGSVAAFRERGRIAALELARRLDLEPQIAEATDPFFAPRGGEADSVRGRALFQRVRSLKHELLLPLGAGRSIAAGSFNDHAEFFGVAFGIRLPDGAPAISGCVAFGVERWLLAVLVRHGTEARDWPTVDVETSDTTHSLRTDAAYA